jgi:hypothetical protein
MNPIIDLDTCPKQMTMILTILIGLQIYCSQEEMK